MKVNKLRSPIDGVVIVPELRFHFCSVVIPAFNEVESLGELVSRVAATFHGLNRAGDFEILIIDDGSSDETPQVLRALVEAGHTYLRWVRLRRNFGKSLALAVGFRHVRGDVVVTMDADLQDNPEDIPVLLAGLDEGGDLANGRREKRQDTTIRRWGSALYNRAVKSATGLDVRDLNCGFKAYRRKLVDALCIYGQYHRFIPVQAHLLGFKVVERPIRNSARKFGSSKFRTLRYEGLFDLLSLLFTSRYGLNPLHFFGALGLVLMVPAALVIGYLIVSQFLFLLGFGTTYQVADRPLLQLSVMALLLGGLVFLTGLACDFVLNLQIRSKLGGIINQVVDEVSLDGGGPGASNG